MSGTLVGAAPRFSWRRRKQQQARQRVLTEHGAESLGPSSAPRGTRARRGARFALVLSLALHAAFLGVAWWRAGAHEPARVAQELFPITVIWEEPEAVAVPPSVPEPPAPAPAPRRVRRAPPRAPEPPPNAPLAEAAPPPVSAAQPAASPVGAGAPALAPAQPLHALAQPLRALAQPAPRYPRAARLRGAEGTVWLRVDVAASGRVERVELERSAGHRDLDRAALAAVRGWLFAPLPEEIERSDRWFRVPIEFRLR